MKKLGLNLTGKSVIPLVISLMVISGGCSGARSNNWEYACLATYIENNGEQVYYWATSSQIVKAPSFEALMQKLNIKVKEGSLWMTLLDHMGQQGWELVSHDAPIVPRNDGGIFSVKDEFYFKRPSTQNQK